MHILHESLFRLGFDKGEFFGIKILPLVAAIAINAVKITDLMFISFPPDIYV